MGNPLLNNGGANNNFGMMQMLAALAQNKNPVAALSAINPQLAQILQGKTPQQIEQFVRGEYAKRGINIDNTLQQIQQLLQSNKF